VLYGSNGEGKTNILESISLFSKFGSLKRAKYDEMINRKNQDRDGWRITLSTSEFDFSVTYNKVLSKKVYKLNDNIQKDLTEFSKYYYILWFTYEMDRLFLQPPSSRRDFIDMFCSVRFANHVKNIRTYEKLTKDRLKILKTYSDSHGKMAIENWLDVLENQIAEAGLAIADNRVAIVHELEKNQINDTFPKFKNEMTGSLEESILTLDCFSRCSAYKKELYDRRIKDSFSGMTTFGPSRSDWRVLYANKMVDAPLCSAGEQKMLLSGVFLSFVASCLQQDSRFLVLLLDDVMVHLDAAHKLLLFGSIREFVTQHAGKLNVWLSGVEKESFLSLGENVSFFRVHGGLVEEG
jgi:DNA replication and repair protein RecF